MPFDGTNLTEVQQLLIKARGLAEDGWCRGTLHTVVNGKDHYCILGAINTAVILSVDALDKQQRISDKVTRVVMSALSKPYDSIESYNDARTRRKHHVLALFDRAIVSDLAKQE